MRDVGVMVRSTGVGHVVGGGVLFIVGGFPTAALCIASIVSQAERVIS